MRLNSTRRSIAWGAGLGNGGRHPQITFPGPSRFARLGRLLPGPLPSASAYGRRRRPHTRRRRNSRRTAVRAVRFGVGGGGGGDDVCASRPKRARQTFPPSLSIEGTTGNCIRAAGGRSTEGAQLRELNMAGLAIEQQKQRSTADQ